MSLSQCRRVEARDSYLHLHGLVFETSIYSWQDQPGKLASFSGFFAAPFSRRFARRRDLTPRTLPPPRAGRSPSVPRLRARSFFRCSDDWRRAACELLFEPACISIFSRRSFVRPLDATSLLGVSQSDRPSAAHISLFSGRRSSGRSMQHPCVGFRNPIGHPPLTLVSFPAARSVRYTLSFSRAFRNPIRRASHGHPPHSVVTFRAGVRPAARSVRYTLSFSRAFRNPIRRASHGHPPHSVVTFRAGVRPAARSVRYTLSFSRAFRNPIRRASHGHPPHSVVTFRAGVRPAARSVRYTLSFSRAFRNPIRRASHGHPPHSVVTFRAGVRPAARSVRYTLSFSRAFRNPIRRASHGHPPHTVVSFWAGVCLVARSFASSFVRSFERCPAAIACFCLASRRLVRLKTVRFFDPGSKPTNLFS